MRRPHDREPLRVIPAEPASRHRRALAARSKQKNSRNPARAIAPRRGIAHRADASARRLMHRAAARGPSAVVRLGTQGKVSLSRGAVRMAAGGQARGDMAISGVADGTSNTAYYGCRSIGILHIRIGGPQARLADDFGEVHDLRTDDIRATRAVRVWLAFAFVPKPAGSLPTGD